jgi:hypothetical protein
MYTLDPWLALAGSISNNWQEYDLSASIPANSTLAVIRVHSPSGSGNAGVFEARHPSSTVDLETIHGSNAPSQAGGVIHEYVVPVFEQKIEFKVWNNASFPKAVYVTGYFTSNDGKHILDRTDITPAVPPAATSHPLMDGTWQEIDVSTFVSAKAKWVNVEFIITDAGSVYSHNFRAPGTTHALSATQGYKYGQVVIPLSADKKFEWYGQQVLYSAYPSSALTLYIGGYMESGTGVADETAETFTNAGTGYEAHTVTGGPSDTTAVILKAKSPSGNSFDIRPTGQTDSFYALLPAYAPSTRVVPLSSSNQFDMRFGFAGGQTVYVSGYLTPGLGVEETATATDATIQSLFTPVVEESASAADAIEEGETIGTGELTLPITTGSGTGTTVINEATAGFDLPVIETTSEYNPTGVTGEGAIENPSPDVEATGTFGGSAKVALELPVHSIVGGEATTEQVGTLASDMQPITLAGVGADGEIATGSCTLPVHEVEGLEQVGEGSPELPVVTVSGGTSEEEEFGDDHAATSAIILPGYSIEAACINNGIGTGELYYPAGYNPAIVGIGSTVANATLAVEVPVVVVLGAGVDGESGTSTISLPGYELDGGGFFAVTGSGAVVTPVFVIDSTAKAFDEDLSSRNKLYSEGWVPLTTEAGSFLYSEGNIAPLPLYEVMVSTMETNTHAVTEYQNYSFNSLTAHRATAYGANEGGIYKLDGSDDAGTAIPIEVQKLSMGADSARLKRATDVYIYLRCDGSYSYSPISDGTLVPLASVVAKTGLSTQKADLPRGLKGRALGFKITNVDGSDIEIDEFEMVVKASSRRDK